MTFEFFPLRFRFVARGNIHFPAGKPGNVLRGAFGAVFKRIACVPDCEEVQKCALRDRCAYARIFEPSAIAGQSPSGLADWPRPFVFRARHLDGRTIAPGDAFHFDLNLFDLHPPTLAYFILAFADIAREGLGPGRGQADLTEVWLLDASGQPASQLY